MQRLPVLLLLPLLRLLQGGLQAGSVVVELLCPPLPLQLQLALWEVQLLDPAPAEGLPLLADLQLLLDVGGPVLAALLRSWWTGSSLSTSSSSLFLAPLLVP